MAVMNMNRCFVMRKEDRQPEWHVIDASDRILGRLATEVADILRGKNRPEFTPQADAGDYVIITNCDKIKLTGNKWKGKTYEHYTGYRSGLRSTTAEDLFKKDPTALIKHAVKGMLPKNTLNKTIIKKLKVYVGTDHPHKAQVK